MRSGRSAITVAQLGICIKAWLAHTWNPMSLCHFTPHLPMGLLHGTLTPCMHWAVAKRTIMQTMSKRIVTTTTTRAYHTFKCLFKVAFDVISIAATGRSFSCLLPLSRHQKIMAKRWLHARRAYPCIFVYMARSLPYNHLCVDCT